MGRDGSDSDYLREHGYGFLVEGDIPSNWGDDSYEEYEDPEPDFFHSFQEAKKWALNNPGRTITRSPDGKGFIIKK